MMLLAGLCAIVAAVRYQTTIFLWELGIGGPILIITAIFMLRLRGGWRWLAALLAAGPAAWAIWQLHTYLPLLPDFLPKSWPVLCFLPIACLLAILATLRSWRSLWSAGYVLVPGKPPRKKRAPGGVIFAALVVGAVAGVGYLPNDARSALLQPLRPSARSPLTGTAGTVSSPAKQNTAHNYAANPVLPPANSTPAPAGVAVPQTSTAKPPSNVGNRWAAYNGASTAKPQEPPRPYPNLNADLARAPLVQDVTAAQTAGQVKFTMNHDYKIVQRKMNADGTESLRMQASTISEDSQGGKAQGLATMDVVMDAQGHILKSTLVSIVDPETKLLTGEK